MHLFLYLVTNYNATKSKTISISFASQDKTAVYGNLIVSKISRTRKIRSLTVEDTIF